MTKKDEWYKNRILWKAETNKLFDYSSKKFEELDKKTKECIVEKIPVDLIPVLVFFDNCSTWTALCTQGLCSYHDNEFCCIPKNKLNQKITPHIKKNNTVIAHNQEKKIAKWLKMNETEEYIWFPDSEALWSFWGLIQMLARLK